VSLQGKHPVKSKTIGFNLLLLGALFAKEHFGIRLSDNDLLLIGALGNILLRFVTKEAIRWPFSKP